MEQSPPAPKASSPPVSARVRKTIEAEIANYQERIRMLTLIGDHPEIAALSFWTWRDPKEMHIEPVKGVEARALALAVLNSLRSHEVAVTRATKKLDERTGKITYELPGPKGWMIHVSGGDPRCKVTAVTEEVRVPGIPAHMETRTRYVLENPEECGASNE